MINKQESICGYQDERNALVKKIIERHKRVQGALIPVLHQIQQLWGYLPEEQLKMVSRGLEIPMTEIFGVASFYSLFSLQPKGKHVINVCLGTACYVKGAQSVMDKISNELNINVGETTEDKLFTLDGARCVGACGLAPVMTIDGKVYGNVTPETVPGILSQYQEQRM